MRSSSQHKPRLGPSQCQICRLLYRTTYVCSFIIHLYWTSRSPYPSTHLYAWRCSGVVYKYPIASRRRRQAKRFYVFSFLLSCPLGSCPTEKSNRANSPSFVLLLRRFVRILSLAAFSPRRSYRVSLSPQLPVIRTYSVFPGTLPGAHFSRPPRTPTLRPTFYATKLTSTLIC